MITVTECTDLSLLHILLTRPEIWPWISDDGVGSPAQWRPPLGPKITYVVARTLTGAPVGVFCGQRLRAGVMEIHTALLPQYRGRIGLECCAAGLDWVRERSMAKTLLTWVPEGNAQAAWMARRCGFALAGRVPASWATGGRMVPASLYYLEL